MLTNKNFTTEAIVAKYVTTVNNFAKEAGVKDIFNPISEKDEVRFSPHQQLIASWWFSHEGCQSKHYFCHTLSEYINSFRKSILSDEEYSYLLAHYSEAIEYLFSVRDDWAFITPAVNDLPKEVAVLSSYILSLEEGQTLYLPLCGYGDIAIKFPQCNIVGTVENEKVASFTQIRLDAAGIKSNIIFSPLGVLNTEVVSNYKVDAIICAAIDNIIYLSLGFTLEEMYDALKPDGKMVALCSNFVLSSSWELDEEFRTRIYEDKSIDAVIQLPKNVMKDTDTAPSMLCIDKASKPKEKEGIIMFNASFASSGVGISNRLKRIDVDRVLFAIKNGNLPEFENIIRNVPYDKIDASILTPKFYLLDRDTTSIRRLTDLVTFVPPTEAPEGRYYSYVLTGNLATSFSDAKLSLERINESSPSVKVPQRYIRCYNAEPCIFLTLIGEEVHLAYSEVLDKDAFYRALSNVMCLKVKENIPIDYVAALLFTKEIKEQLTAMVPDTSICHLDNHMLSKVIVPEHNKEQMSLFLEDALKASLTQREKEILNERKEYERGVRLRKHALTQSVSSLSALFNQLNKCRLRQGGVLHNEDLVNPILNKTVEEVFVTLASKMEVIQKKLAHIADIDLDFGEPVDIDPEEFILNYLRSKKSGWANFTGEVSWDARETTNKFKLDLRDPFDNILLYHAGDTMTSFSFPKDALEHIFNNIVANAASHGFTDESQSNYKVRFSWETQGMDVVITVENNGTPLPNEVNPEDILKSGFSTRLNHEGHAGSGGYEIASIMRDYNGDVDVVSCPGSEFPVKYVLRFHKARIITPSLIQVAMSYPSNTKE